MSSASCANTDQKKTKVVASDASTMSTFTGGEKITLAPNGCRQPAQSDHTGSHNQTLNEECCVLIDRS